MDSRVFSTYPFRTAIAFGLAALATVLAWIMDGGYSLTSQAMLYLLAVVYAAFQLGRYESVLTAVLGVSALNFFFIPPRYRFDVENAEYLITLGALLLVSLLVSGLAAKLKAETEHAQRRERRARQLHALNEQLADAAGEPELLQHGSKAVFDAFAVSCCVMTVNAQGALETVAEVAAEQAHFDFDAARWCFDNRQCMGPTTMYWPALGAWYAPLIGGDQALGAIAVDLARCTEAVTADDRRHLETMAGQIALALHRARLVEAATASVRAIEAESVRTALLASISHDLRTPLAVILGSATTLSEQHDRLSEIQRDALVRTISDEAAQMTATAENILEMARLSSGALALRRDWESLEEIVGAVIGRVRKRKPGCRIRARVPAGLPLLRVDAVLIAQVLSNLVDNAIKHAPLDTIIEVQVEDREALVEIAVKDCGPGIGGEDPVQLFDMFYRGRAEQGGNGVGLGLAICKAIVEAHGGGIRAHNRKSGGAAIRFTLPRTETAPEVAP